MLIIIEGSLNDINRATTLKLSSSQNNVRLYRTMETQWQNIYSIKEIPRGKYVVFFMDVN